MDDRMYDSILRLHEKLDDQARDIAEIKIQNAGMGPRVKILEKVVYGVVGFILVVFMVSLADTPKESIASVSKNTSIIRKALDD